MTGTINTGDFVRFWRTDCNGGVSFKEGSIYKVSKGGNDMKAMVYIGDIACWKTSLELSTKDAYDSYVAKHGITPTKSTKKVGKKTKKTVEIYEGKEMIAFKKSADCVLLSVDGGACPATISEAKKLCGIKRAQVWDFKTFKDATYNFAVRNLKVVQNIKTEIVEKEVEAKPRKPRGTGTKKVASASRRKQSVTKAKF